MLKATKINPSVLGGSLLYVNPKDTHPFREFIKTGPLQVVAAYYLLHFYLIQHKTEELEFLNESQLLLISKRLLSEWWHINYDIKKYIRQEDLRQLSCRYQWFLDSLGEFAATKISQVSFHVLHKLPEEFFDVGSKQIPSTH